MTNQRLETLAWVLIYGGLGAAVVGVVLRDAHAALGWTLIVAGGVVAAAGAVAIWLRARRDAAASASLNIDPRRKP